MVGSRHYELKSRMRVLTVPTTTLLCWLAVAAAALPLSQAYYRKYAYPENLDYNSGYNQPPSGYEQQPGSFDSYPDPAMTFADPSPLAYGDDAYDYNSFGQQIDPQMALDEQQLQDKIDEELRQIFGSDLSRQAAPSQFVNTEQLLPPQASAWRMDQAQQQYQSPDQDPSSFIQQDPVSRSQQDPSSDSHQLEKKRVPDILEDIQREEQETVESKFPRLTLRQKQFAVNPSMPEYYADHPDFLTFRLQELDEELRGAADKGKGAKDGEAGEDGSGDDPQQILLGAKRARIGAASHLRWEDFAMDNKDTDFFFTIAIAVSTAFAICGVVGAGYCYHRRIRVWKDSEEVEYPSYGVTGPAKDVSPGGSDRKLAQSAQIYHYQHQKNQMLGNGGGLGAGGEDETEGEDSEGEEQEGDYTVYECPGLAATDEMEVKNPLFDYADPTPKP